MINSLSCAQCQTFDFESRALYYNKDGSMIGEWPLYYFGAGPNNPDQADVYFCSAYCVNAYHKENMRYAQEGTDE